MTPYSHARERNPGVQDSLFLAKKARDICVLGFCWPDVMSNFCDFTDEGGSFDHTAGVITAALRQKSLKGLPGFMAKKSVLASGRMQVLQKRKRGTAMKAIPPAVTALSGFSALPWGRERRLLSS